jgi:hypothetical protein
LHADGLQSIREALFALDQTPSVPVLVDEDTGANVWEASGLKKAAIRQL